MAAGAIVVLGGPWLGDGLVGLLAAGSAYTVLFVGLGALLRCCTYLRPAAIWQFLGQLLRPRPADAQSPA